MQSNSATNAEDCQQLLNRFRPLLSLVARKHMRRRYRGRFDESDVVQVACLEASRSFGTFRGTTEAEWLAWMETILKRSLATFHEHHSSLKRDVNREIASEPTRSVFDSRDCFSIIWTVASDRDRGPVSHLIEGEKALLLASALQRLGEEHRVAIELRFLDGMKLREIAEVMQSSVGRVAGLLRRGLDDLQNLLPSELRDDLEGPDS